MSVIVAMLSMPGLPLGDIVTAVMSRCDVRQSGRIGWVVHVVFDPHNKNTARW
jgi:hypothetical protein